MSDRPRSSSDALADAMARDTYGSPAQTGDSARVVYLVGRLLKGVVVLPVRLLRRWRSRTR